MKLNNGGCGVTRGLGKVSMVRAGVVCTGLVATIYLAWKSIGSSCHLTGVFSGAGAEVDAEASSLVTFRLS